MDIAITIWYVIVAAVLVWYTTVTIYVGIKGAIDIKHMLKRLDDIRNEEATQGKP